MCIAMSRSTNFHCEDSPGGQEKAETADELRLRIDFIAGFIQSLDNTKFTRFGDSWVYPEPLKAQKPLGYFTDKKDVLVHMDLPEQVLLQESLADKFGFKPRLGSLKENFQLALSKESTDYRNGVLEKYFVFTGELAKKDDTEVGVRRVVGVEFLDKTLDDMPDEFLADSEGNEFPAKAGCSGNRLFQVKYRVAAKLEESLPGQEGFFSDFRVIPTDKDLAPSGMGHYFSSHVNAEGFSALQCFWVGQKNVFGVYASEPLCRSSGIAIPIWTDENPTK